MHPTKYPSTPYLDLKSHPFLDREIIVTEKRDGENTKLYSDRIHARSVDSRHHPSRAWVKMFHAQIRNLIPESVAICGENLYAEHSIHYDALPSYFEGFAVHDELSCYSWHETREMFAHIGITPVPVLFRGVCQKNTLSQLIAQIDVERQEGFVVRLADRFLLKDFDVSAQKWVRPGHVQTDEHWMYREVVVNGLAAILQF
jgi:hypothetical protein